MNLAPLNALQTQEQILDFTRRELAPCRDHRAKVFLFALYGPSFDPYLARTTLERMLKDRVVREVRPLQMKRIPTDPWKFEGVDPDDWVTVSFGGGEHFLKDFLEGRVTGYYNEVTMNADGIFVAPHVERCRDISEKREWMYAVRALTTWLDQPIVLTAEIQAKHLTATHNRHEALLLPEDIPYLQDVRLERILIGAGEDLRKRVLHRSIGYLSEQAFKGFEREQMVQCIRACCAFLGQRESDYLPFDRKKP